MSVSNVLTITPLVYPTCGVNPVNSFRQNNFVYYKLSGQSVYNIRVCQGFRLDKLYYIIVGKGGLGGAKNNSDTPFYGSCGGGGGGGLVFPVDSRITPPINISACLSCQVFADPTYNGQSNFIQYVDSSNNNIRIECRAGFNGIIGNRGPSDAPSGQPGVAGGNGGNGGQPGGGGIVLPAGTFGSAGANGGLGGLGVPLAGNPTTSGIPGSTGQRGVSQPSSTSVNGVSVVFADNSSGQVGKPGAGGDNRSNVYDPALGNGTGGETGYVLLYYDSTKVEILK